MSGWRELPTIQPRFADASWLGNARKGTRDFTCRLPLKTANTVREETTRRVSIAACLTPEERARITELQDVLIERFVDHRETVADGREARSKELQAEIDGLLREKEEIATWAAVGSAYRNPT